MPSKKSLPLKITCHIFVFFIKIKENLKKSAAKTNQSSSDETSKEVNQVVRKGFMGGKKIEMSKLEIIINLNNI